MPWGRLVVLSMMLALLVGAKPTRTVRLGWETTVTSVTGWDMDQCLKQGQTCTMARAAWFTGAVQEWVVPGLDIQQSYCWRVRPLTSKGSQAWSTTVCD